MILEKLEYCPLCEADYATQYEYDFQICNNCDPIPTIEEIEAGSFSTAQVAAMAKRIAELEAELSALEAQREWVNKSEAAAFECQYEETSYHPKLHLLAKERTGWRRWVFGRWVYKSEPFRRDIQRRCARAGLHTLHEEPWERWHDPDDV